MNKEWILPIAAVVLLAGVVLYVSTRDGNPPTDDGSEPSGSEPLTYSSPILGLEFDYPTGEEGFILEEAPLADPNPNALENLVLWHASDYDQVLNPPQGGEGPPNITVRIFKNPQRQSPRAWAEANIQYSNINLKMSEPTEAVVGGANAIRYPADGLYPAEVVVVAHGENMYVFIGSYRDPESHLRRGFQPILDSVRFIPQAGQE